MKPTKSKLGNPEAIAKAVEKTTEVIPFLIKTAVFLGLGYWGYQKFTNRFVKRKENTSYDPANVSMAQAQARADAIYGSISLFSNDFENVARQIAQLNYNGYVRVYNAFGNRRGTLFSGELNLEEWCYNQFTPYQVSQLSMLLGGVFFK